MSIFNRPLVIALGILLASTSARAGDSTLRVLAGIGGTVGHVQLHNHPAASLGCTQGPDCNALRRLPGTGTTGRLHLETGAELYEWLLLGRISMVLNDGNADRVWRLAAGREIFATAFGRTSALLSIGYDNNHLGGGIGEDVQEGTAVLLEGRTVGVVLRHQLNLAGPLAVGAEVSYDLMFAKGWSVWDDGGGAFDPSAKVGLFRAGLFLGVDLELL